MVRDGDDYYFSQKKYCEENQVHVILEKSLHFWVEEKSSSLFGSFEFFQDHEEIFDTVQLLSESVSKIFSAANTVSFWDLYLDVFHFAFVCLPHSFLSASFSARLCACLCLWKWESSRYHAHLSVSSSGVCLWKSQPRVSYHLTVFTSNVRAFERERAWGTMLTWLCWPQIDVSAW